MEQVLKNKIIIEVVGSYQSFISFALNLRFRVKDALSSTAFYLVLEDISFS